MKTRNVFCLVSFVLLMSSNTFSQGFVEAVEDDALSALFGNECFLKLISGEEIHRAFS